MQTLEPLLAAHPLFRDLKPEHLQVLVGCASNVRFDAGAYLLREGDQANTFYLVRTGQIALEASVPGRGTLTIQTIGEGDVLGWSWLVPPYRWQYDARAVTLVRALALDGKCLREKCEENHDLGFELLKRFTLIMQERLQATRLQLLDIYGHVAGR